MMSLKYTDKSVSKNVRYKERKNMKKIEAIIRTDKLEDLKAALSDNGLVHGMTVSQVLGYGEQKGFTEYVRGQRIETTLLSKLKIEIVSIDEKVDDIVNVIIKAVSSCSLSSSPIASARSDTRIGINKAITLIMIQLTRAVKITVKTTADTLAKSNFPEP